MGDDDFGDLYTDVEPKGQNESSRVVSLQGASQMLYSDYDEDEDEALLYTSLEDSLRSAPKNSTLLSTARPSVSETLEFCERDSEELLLYGLLDEGSYEIARKEEHSSRDEAQHSSSVETQHFSDFETQHFVKDEFPTLQTVKAFKEAKTEQETLHGHIQPEEELVNFIQPLKIESFSGDDNAMTTQDNQGTKTCMNDEEVEAELGAEITPPGLSIRAKLTESSAEDDVEQDWIQKDVQGFGTEAEGYNDVDSESEDDLQILLNDDNLLYAGSERTLDRVVEGSEDEDEEDLVIVSSNEPPDDGEWVEDQMQPLDVSLPASSGAVFVPGAVAAAASDERGQGAKANLGAIGNIAAPRLGYIGKPYHPQPHHSQFKYVRPGLAPVGAPNSTTASSAQAVAQVPKMQSGVGTWASGRGFGGPSMSGRGDWGGAGRGSSGSQRPMLGAGMPYGHSARGFQYGMEFSLPSGKSVFDIDLDAFEDKPWRHPSADFTDYFNFSFNETTWKQYCTQLAQLRLEATMQSKIRVYVSGRSDQDYDPDLPPELRAAAGGHEASGEINHLQMRMQDNGRHCNGGRGQGAGRGREIFPIGRAIQVEGGGADRIPSSDIKRQRARDSDSVIQIVLHDPDAEEENDGQDEAEENSASALQTSMKHDQGYEDNDAGTKLANFEQEGHLQKSGYSNEQVDPALNDWERNSPSLVNGIISNIAPHSRNGLAACSSMGAEGQKKFHSGLGRPGNQHPGHIQDYAILPGPPSGPPPPPLARGGTGRPIYGGPRPGMPLPGLLPMTGMSDGMRPILPRVEYSESARQRVPRMSTPHRLSSQGRVHDSDEEHGKQRDSGSKEQNISRQELHPQRNINPAMEDAVDQEFEPDTDVFPHEASDQRKQSISQDYYDDEGLDSHSEDRKLQHISKRQKIYTSMDDKSRSGSASMKVPKASESETSKEASKSVEQSVEEESSDFLLKEKLSAEAVHNMDELEQGMCIKKCESSKSRSYRSGSDTRVIRQERGVRKGRKEEWSEIRPFRHGEESMVRLMNTEQMMYRRGMIGQDRWSQKRDEKSLFKKKEDEQKRRDHLEEQWHRREREREKERERERARERERERERERDDVQLKERRDIPRERERERDDLQLKERRDIQRRQAVEEDVYRRQRKEDESACDPERERDDVLKERRDLQRRKTEEDIYHRQRKEEENVRDAKIRRHNDTKFRPAYGRDDNRARHDIRAVQGARDDYSKDRHRIENQRLKSRERSDQLREGDGRTRQFDVKNEPNDEDHTVHRDRNSRHDGTMNVRKGYSDPQRHVEAPSPHKERHRWPANLTKGGEQGRNGSRSMMPEYTSKHPSGIKKIKVEDYQRNEFNEKAYTRVADDKGADISQPGRMDKRSLGEKSFHGVTRRLKAEPRVSQFLTKNEDYPQNRSTSFDNNDGDRRKGRSKLERWTSRKEKGHLPSKVTSKEDKMKVLDYVHDSGARIDEGHKEEMAISNKSQRGDRNRDRSQENQSQFSETGGKDAKEKHYTLLPHAHNLQEQEKPLMEEGRENLASEAPDDPGAKFTSKEDAEEHLMDGQQHQSDMAASLARRKERFRSQAKNDSDAERKLSQTDEEVERKQEQNRESDVIEEVKQERPARKRRWGGA